LKDVKKELGIEFNLEFDIINAEKSGETKAKQARPGKPAILIK
jgi:hypothetical protein